ncbi:hypothetical protein KDW_63130 [Dictyobacter vulcani]|uniref:TIR domain-containing protein n=1 Tax=Dictyobacter vulcani TaxID=2607529 RepID=A0A5J4L064_9CHLR|nr:toll/interleukin-1 receptor domain-containing protein [Dictyobacter vulcani]GER92151.1 hypothetical protein KDW_63130 [Dictyobacter vulcani]
MLFLGAGAGGLFRSKTFYSTAQSFSPRTFHNMTQIKQFEECYRVLCEGDFSRSDIHSILVPSLQSLKIAQADQYLANLVQAGIFHLIISTNIDNQLSKAFEAADMRVGQDFQIFIPQQHSPDKFANTGHKHVPTIIKLSGDLEIGEHSLFKQNFYLETHDMLKTFLSSTLSGDVLMLGYNPFWDRAIDAIFPAQGQEIWYINEEKPRPPFLSILQSRKAKCITGGAGSYEAFIQQLHWHLDEERSPHESLLHVSWETNVAPTPLWPDTQNAPTATQEDSHYQQTTKEQKNEKKQRTNVFIGYSHIDKNYLKRLKSHMATYEREKLLDVWDDQKVQPGTNYRQELQNALNNAKVIILLVSSDFIASDFVAENILAPLLQISETKGAVVLPVILRSCNFDDSGLQQFQPFNHPSKPLSKKSVDQDAVWADLARYVVTLGRDTRYE